MPNYGIFTPKLTFFSLYRAPTSFPREPPNTVVNSGISWKSKPGHRGSVQGLESLTTVSSGSDEGPQKLGDNQDSQKKQAAHNN